MRRIDTIIVHCTATPAGKDYTVADVRRWHKLRGWSDVGYHYLVRLDGLIESGRPPHRVGAHCAGHNAHSIGVCYVGGCTADGRRPADTRTSAQRKSLRALLRTLLQLYPAAVVRSHRDFNAAKACPAFDATAEYAPLVAEAANRRRQQHRSPNDAGRQATPSPQSSNH